MLQCPDPARAPWPFPKLLKHIILSRTWCQWGSQNRERPQNESKPTNKQHWAKQQNACQRVVWFPCIPNWHEGSWLALPPVHPWGSCPHFAKSQPWRRLCTAFPGSSVVLLRAPASSSDLASPAACYPWSQVTLTCSSLKQQFGSQPEIEVGLWQGGCWILVTRPWSHGFAENEFLQKNGK